MMDVDKTNASAHGYQHEYDRPSGACSIQKEELLERVRMFLEAEHQNETRPLPVLLNGKEVDLFKLCMQVRACGGYDKATQAFMWSPISESLGFGRECGPSLKLVYVKYLRDLKSWTLVSSQDIKNGFHLPLSVHSSSKITNLQASINTEQGSVDVFAGNGAKPIEGPSGSHQEGAKKTACRGEGPTYVQDGHAIGNCITERNVSAGIKSIADVLEWLKRLALNPGDMKKGQGSRGSRQNEAWVERCQAMANKIRAVLWKRTDLVYHQHPTGSLNKRRIRPDLYYKEILKPNKQTMEKLRANEIRAMKCGSQRSISGNTFQIHGSRSSWLSLSASQMLALGQYSEHRSDGPNTYLKYMQEMVNMEFTLNTKASRKRIPIGTDFQAQVPPWTNPARPVFIKTEMKDALPSTDSCHSESETRLWLGSLMWPIPGLDGVVNKGRIGRGRPRECDCVDRYSIECVRSYVLAERGKLKTELREAFDNMGFNDMGETVSELWTKDEESAFELFVKMNPSSMGHDFWDAVRAAFPSKGTRELVSYYFNVFVLRRRALENRVVPEAVDSDDDERELLIRTPHGLASKAYEDRPSFRDGNMNERTSIVLKDLRLRLCSVDTLLTSANGLRHSPCSLEEEDESLHSLNQNHSQVIQMVGQS